MAHLRFKRRFATNSRCDRCHSDHNLVGFRRIFKLISRRDCWRHVRVEQLCSHSTEFREILHWDFFFLILNSVSHIEIRLHSGKNIGSNIYDGILPFSTSIQGI